MQVARDIYLIGGYPYPYYKDRYGLKLKNMYAIKGKDGIVLVDTGEDETQLAIAYQNLEYWGLSDLPITHVLITHSHFAHCANAHIFKEKGALIIAGQGDAEGIETGDDRTINYAFTHQKKFTPCKVDKIVRDGDKIETAGLEFSVIHTPGHSPGSVIYRIVMYGKIILFTGDTVAVNQYCSGSRLGWTGGADYDQGVYLQTINRICTMEADFILPGDFQPCLREGWQMMVDLKSRSKMKVLNQPADK